MYNDELIKELNTLQDNHEVGALAVIVRREAPSSGKPGDKAIIKSNGEVKGWIGGGCTKGIVIKEGLEAIDQRTPRLVKILPQEDLPDAPGVKNYKMTCMSGGSIEVYIEPIMPQSRIFIFGRSHIAKALCEVGNAAGFQMHVVSDFVDDEMFENASTRSTLKEFDESRSLNNDFVVVCTQGENDAQSLLAGLKTNPKYVGFVSSRKKANSILMGLKREGISHDQLVKIKTPAGLDLNAKTPEEVAISILAQIIQEKRSDDTTVSKNEFTALELKETEDLYINPVCKIPVQKSSAKHVIEHNGEKVYFCCDGCKESFEKEPEAYIS